MHFSPGKLASCEDELILGGKMSGPVRIGTSLFRQILAGCDFILQWRRTPEQRLYEGIRPITLFGIPPAERSEETGVAESTLCQAASAFDTHGMINLFLPTKAQREDHHRSLPVPMRQLIVDLKSEYPEFTAGEIATICSIQFAGRRPSHHIVQAVLADGPPPSRTDRQFPPYDEIGSPEERRHAVIRLHARAGVFRRLHAIWRSRVQRFTRFSRAGSRKGCRVLLRNHTPIPADRSRFADAQPDSQETRRESVARRVSYVCSAQAVRYFGSPMNLRPHHGRESSALRNQATPKEPHKPKPQPFKAASRNERWCLDIRYIEKHRIPEIKGSFYVIAVMDDFSRAILSSDIFQSQDPACVLIVLYAAIEQFGAPQRLITDNGGIFRAKQLLAICEALDIEKEYIHSRQSIVTAGICKPSGARFAPLAPHSWHEIGDVCERVIIVGAMVQQHPAQLA